MQMQILQGRNSGVANCIGSPTRMEEYCLLTTMRLGAAA